jgi:hypothetical protein
MSDFREGDAVVVASGGPSAVRPGPPYTTLWDKRHNGIYFAPWVVSDGASQWLAGSTLSRRSMDTAQRYVAGYLDAMGRMTTCRAGQVSDARPQRRHPVAGWLMGVQLGGHSDADGGHLAGGRTGPT